MIVTHVSLIHKVIRIVICKYMDRCNEMLYVFYYCYVIISTYLYYREACTLASEIE